MESAPASESASGEAALEEGGTEPWKAAPALEAVPDVVPEVPAIEVRADPDISRKVIQRTPTSGPINVDQDNIGLITQTVTQDMTQAQVDVAIQEARVNADIWAVLTPEQQTKATKLRAERQAQMEQRRQERRTQ